MMINWFIVLGVIYAGALVVIAVRERRTAKSAKDFLFAGKGIGPFLGFLTFSASLFSTFTIQGMPNFFRTHGVGSWVFLGVTDVFMAFVLLYFGLKLRRTIRNRGASSMSDLIRERFGSKLPMFVYLVTVFVFLVPYVSIQLKGVAVFLNYYVPIWHGEMTWSALVLVAILVYSGMGGLRAIALSDAFQGMLLIIVVWLIGVICLEKAGGMSSLTASLAANQPKLLTLPGPHGLLSPLWLLSSFVAIALMPLTQPQLTARIMVIKTDYQFIKMCIAIGVFAFLVILPTAFIGLFGSFAYPEADGNAFLGMILSNDLPEWLGALFLVGLLAAAMSTADSILFALGVELSGGTSRRGLSSTKTKMCGGLFAVLTYVLATQTFPSLVLLARVSFVGTSLLAPLIMMALTSGAHRVRITTIATILSIFVYIMVLVKLVPGRVVGTPVEMLLLFTTAAIAFLEYMAIKRKLT